MLQSCEQQKFRMEAEGRHVVGDVLVVNVQPVVACSTHQNVLLVNFNDINLVERLCHQQVMLSFARFNRVFCHHVAAVTALEDVHFFWICW